MSTPTFGPNNRNLADFSTARRGDYVQVFLNTPGMGSLIGYVIRSKEGWLGLAVHTFRARSRDDLQECIGWEASIPMSSVLFTRHMGIKTTGCKCDDLRRARS